NVKLTVLQGSCEEGLAFIKSLDPEVPKTIVWLSFSTNDLTREESSRLLVSYRNAPDIGDALLIEVQADAGTLQISSMFRVNHDNFGLSQTNILLKQDVFDRNAFEYKETYSKEEKRHEAFYKVRKAHRLTYQDPETGTETTMDLAKDELIHAGYTYTWPPNEMKQLFEKTGLTRVEQWTANDPWMVGYNLYLVRKTTD
ncbi:hypothetical protein BGZ65_007138, partial [Modicella reniformis]